MKLRTLPVVLVVAALSLAACAPATPQVIRETQIVRETQVVRETVEVPVEVTAQPQAVDVVRVSMGYIPNVQYAPWYVGLEKGYFAEEGIQLVLDYSMEADGIELVSSGEREFGIGSGDLLIQARGQGRPLVMVARWYNGVPAAIFSLKDKGITQPADLAGKTLGIPYPGGINYQCLLASLIANGVDPDEVNIQSVGYTQMAAVTGGMVDAATGYSMNEPVQLSVKGNELNVIETREWCPVAPIGLFTTEQLVQENPDLVQRLVRAFLRSVKATLDEPDFALEAVVSAVQFSGGDNRPATKASLEKCLEFWATDGEYGLYTAEQFESTQQLLVDLEQMEAANEIDVSTAFINDFAQNAQP